MAPTKAFLLVNAALLASLLTLSHAILKSVARKPAASYVDLIMHHWWQIGAALSLYGLVFFYYIHVLRGQDIGVLYSTYTALSILFVLLTGVVVFGEVLSMVQIVGCTLVVLGVFCIGQG